MAVSLEGRNTELRKRLVIEKETPSGHRDRVAALKQEIPHTIRCLESPDEGTCVTYALGLLSRFRPLVTELLVDGIRPGSRFVEWLLRERKLAERAGPEPDALALSFDGETWRHAAVVVTGERLRSEWGSYSIFEHQLDELPADYGDTVRFFERPSAEEAARLFFQFGCAELRLSAEEAEQLRALAGVPEGAP